MFMDIRRHLGISFSFWMLSVVSPRNTTERKKYDIIQLNFCLCIVSLSAVDVIVYSYSMVFWFWRQLRLILCPPFDMDSRCVSVVAGRACVIAIIMCVIKPSTILAIWIAYWMTLLLLFAVRSSPPVPIRWPAICYAQFNTKTSYIT